MNLYYEINRHSIESNARCLTAGCDKTWTGPRARTDAGRHATKLGHLVYGTVCEWYSIGEEKSGLDALRDVVL